MYKIRKCSLWVMMLVLLVILPGAAFSVGSDKQLADVYDIINQKGFSQETLTKLVQIENGIHAGGSDITLNDVSMCYNAYANNLIIMNTNKDLPGVIKRWDEALEKVYSSKKIITEQFGLDLLAGSEDLFYMCILVGTDCDPLLLTHTTKIADFFSQRIKVDKSFDKSLYQSALEAKAYALLFNKKYNDLKATVTLMGTVKDQLLGTSLEDIMLVRAYEYMLEGNYSKCDSIVKNYNKIMGKAIIKEAGPIRTGINGLIDDLYQLKKRKIGGEYVSKIMKSLPEPALKITGVSSNGLAGQAGIQTGDLLIMYKGVRCLSYYNLVDLINKNIDQTKVEIVVMRNGKNVSVTTHGGRLGIGLEESYLK